MQAPFRQPSPKSPLLFCVLYIRVKMLGVDGMKNLFFFLNLFVLFSLEHFVDELMRQQWWNHQKRTEVEDLGFPDLEWLLIYWICSHEEEGKNHTANNERTQCISTKTKPNQAQNQTDRNPSESWGRLHLWNTEAKTDPTGGIHRYSQAGRQLPLGSSAQKVRACGFCQGPGNLDGPYREWTYSCTWRSGSNSLLGTPLSNFFFALFPVFHS